MRRKTFWRVRSEVAIVIADPAFLIGVPQTLFVLRTDKGATDEGADSCSFALRVVVLDGMPAYATDCVRAFTLRFAGMAWPPFVEARRKLAHACTLERLCAFELVHRWNLCVDRVDQVLDERRALPRGNRLAPRRAAVEANEHFVRACGILVCAVRESTRCLQDRS